jgi:hypothetical protein
LDKPCGQVNQAAVRGAHDGMAKAQTGRLILRLPAKRLCCSAAQAD